MINMTEKEFLAYSRQGNLIPVVKEIYGDLETPVAAYMKISHREKYAFLLESVEGGEKLVAILNSEARTRRTRPDPDVATAGNPHPLGVVGSEGKRRVQRVVDRRGFSAGRLDLQTAT